MDPEEKRLRELITAVQKGIATDAEREELALYSDDRPDVQALLRQFPSKEDDENVGETWLARVNADRRLKAVERSALAQLEQRVGVGLMVGGAIAGFFFPPALFGVFVGAGLLTLSVLRVKLRTIGKDPYDDIEQ